MWLAFSKNIVQYHTQNIGIDIIKKQKNFPAQRIDFIILMQVILNRVMSEIVAVHLCKKTLPILYNRKYTFHSEFIFLQWVQMKKFHLLHLH
jgi:hypothetical protein